jgi:hypothetical protein
MRGRANTPAADEAQKRVRVSVVVVVVVKQSGVPMRVRAALMLCLTSP